MFSLSSLGRLSNQCLELRIQRLFVVAGFVCIFMLSIACHSFGQVEGNDFEGGFGPWHSWAGGQVSLTDDAYEGASAVAVTSRTEYWHGVTRSLLGELTVGKDYHFTAYVKKLDDGDPKQIRFEIAQTDDRGTRYFPIGHAMANSSEWTMIQGGFTVQANGPLTQLQLIVNASDRDFVPNRKKGGQFSFIVDNVQIVENDWRPAADQRIEEIRKRDLNLGFVKTDGAPATDLNVDVEQIRHHFPFGSTLNHAFMTNPNYAEFFKENFDWATIEWYSQWPAVEPNRGVEDYTIADATLEFAQANGIQLRGHALAFPSEQFLPGWAQNLSDSELQAELEERVTNVVTRYNSQLYSWDVSNEMLDHDLLADQLGESVRPWMFQRARELDANVKLFTNEYSITSSQVKANQYRQMIESINAAGGEVNGIGLQAHFYEGFVSPKAMEIAMSELSDLGAEIWFSEFDFENPDPQERAKATEDFYRYAFSNPDTTGIIMWGFWAGTHWRGEHASLIDLDWTINAQGQKYLELMDEWTTESLDNNTGEAAELSLRGFHGDYLITTVDPETGIKNYHLVKLLPGQDALGVDLITNSVNESLTIYGTDSDDVFQYDFSATNKYVLNGEEITVRVPVAYSSLRFAGGSGDDRLEVTSLPLIDHYHFNETFIEIEDSDLRVDFDVETARLFSQKASSVTFVDSPGDDTLTTYHENSTLQTPNVELIAENFRFVFCRSTAGLDTAWLMDSPLVDRVFTNLDIVSIRLGIRTRRVWDFAQTNVVSTQSSDIFTVHLPLEQKKIQVSPLLVSTELNGKKIDAINFPRVNMTAADGNSDTVLFGGNESSETLRVYKDYLRYSGSGFLTKIFGINQSTQSTDSGGTDLLRLFDTVEDDLVDVTGETATYTSPGVSHSLSHFDNVRLSSENGGTDTATINDAVPVVNLVGDWLTESSESNSAEDQ